MTHRFSVVIDNQAKPNFIQRLFGKTVYQSALDEYLTEHNFLTRKERKTVLAMLDQINNSGTLRIEEFSSILELAPSTMHEVSKILGFITMSEFRAKIADGQISADDFFDALDTVSDRKTLEEYIEANKHKTMMAVPAPYRLEKLVAASLYEEGQDTTGLFVCKPPVDFDMPAFTVSFEAIREAIFAKFSEAPQFHQTQSQAMFAFILDAVTHGHDLRASLTIGDCQNIFDVRIPADTVVEALRGGSNK